MADEKLINLLEEFLLLYKVINRQKIIEILRTELKTDLAIEIYQLTDGEKSTRELAGMLKNKCSHATVASLWNKWALIGLVVPVKQKGRYKMAFDLVEYGITKIEIDKEEA
jgi:hypothetical protein